MPYKVTHKSAHKVTHIKSRLRHTLLLLVTLFLSTSIFAQNGKITGVVVDAETGETLIGANVVIEGTLKGTQTDLDGKYTINNVEPGTYNIVVSYISFTKQTITGVEVEPGETVKLDVQLQPETELLEEVVVTATAVLNNEAGLLAQRQKSIAFSDAISSESITKTGSSDAAAALTKVVGASVVGGKFVFIRGLGDRYSSTHLNGAVLPSADPDRNAFQLDLIPSNVIENIVTLKSFTVDKPGDFSGGLVNVTTKDFPDDLLFNISSSVGFNTRVTFQDGLQGSKTSTDLLGYQNGDRDVPSGLNGINEIPEYGDSFLAFLPEQVTNSQVLDQASKAFNNEVVPTDFTIPFNTGFNVSLGNQFDLIGKNFGYIIGFSHNTNISSYRNGENGQYQLVGEIEDGTLLNTLNLYEDDRTQQNVDLGGLASLSFKLNDNNKFTTSWIRTQSGTLEGRRLNGFREEPSQGGFDNYNSTVILYTERLLSSVQFRGKHVIPMINNATIDWQYSGSRNELGQPDARFFEYGVRTEEDTYSITRAVFQRPSRFYRDLTEDNTNYFADLTIPVNISTGTLNIKTGAYYLEGSRDFNERRFAYEQDPSFSFNNFKEDFTGFFSAVGINEDRSNATFIAYDNYIQDRTNIRNSYIGNREISAAYLSTEVPLGDLKIIAGLRYETTDIEVISDDTTSQQGDIDVEDFLPSVSAIYSVNDNMNLRFSYTNTLARPNYREIAPFTAFDAFGGLVNIGNPDLTRTLITNYDLRWEWFTNVGEIIAVSGFYKQLENPIERVFLIDRVRTRSWQNVPEAEVYGLEFEIRKNLGFITPALEKFSAATNVTLVQSIVDVPEEELEFGLNSDPNFDDTRSLFGQSPFIFNFDLSYFDEKSDLTINLNSNVFGPRLSDVTLGANPDVFDRSYLRTDMIINKNFGSNFSARLSLRNLFDPEIKTSSELNGNEYIYTSFRQGRSISLSISYKL